MLTANDVHQLFEPLWEKRGEEASRPETGLLAHYTSIATLESMLRNREFWLSNPLFMNDHEELAFGINLANQEFRAHEGIRLACRTDERYEKLRHAFEQKLSHLSAFDAFDTYVMCFSLHSKDDDQDGKLSMWRGYGGDGNGAAIIFNVAALPTEGPAWLMLDKVEYGSGEKRREWITTKLNEFSLILSQNEVPESYFYVAVHSLLERFRIFSLFTKHRGFSEEQEWRLVYIRTRDNQQNLADQLGYWIGPRGLEPKLKLNLSKLETTLQADLSWDRVIERIILGPSISNPLMRSTVARMLETLSLSSLSNKLYASGTPYRSK